MAETPAISDRNLEASTNISLKREPACFAFLSSRSTAPPMPIDSINLDLASADYFAGRASLWTALEMRSSVNNDRPTAILGFDETFLRPFARALVEAATTRASYRMTILTENRDSERCRVVEYVTGPGKPLKELVEELDPQLFWQIHRSTLVNARTIAGVARDFRGRMLVKLKGRDDTLLVSDTYTHLFRQM